MVPAAPAHPDLADVLRESQRLGFLGDRPIHEVIEHARSFVTPLTGVTGTLIDLGSGGGVPGLVIAHDRPDLAVVLVDRRIKRTDFLQRMVSRLGWQERVEVVTEDVVRLAERSPASYDAVVARGFGPPAETLRLGAALVRPGGPIVISEPPSGDRWPAELLAELDVHRRDDGAHPVATFSRRRLT